MKARDLRKKKRLLFPEESNGRKEALSRESSFMRSTAPRLESSPPRANLNYYPGYYDTSSSTRVPLLDNRAVSKIRESTFELSEKAAKARQERDARTRIDLRSRKRHRKSKVKLEQKASEREHLRLLATERDKKVRATKPPHRVCSWYPRPELKLKPQSVLCLQQVAFRMHHKSYATDTNAACIIGSHDAEALKRSVLDH